MILIGEIPLMDNKHKNESQDETEEHFTMIVCRLSRPECDHEFTLTGTENDHCIKCGLSVMAYAFMDMP